MLSSGEIDSRFRSNYLFGDREVESERVRASHRVGVGARELHRPVVLFSRSWEVHRDNL